MNQVAVFARRPVMDPLETGLVPALPPEMALELYDGVLADALDAVAGVRAQRHLFRDGEATDGAHRRDFREHRLGEGDRGALLERAFAELLERPGDRAVVLAAEVPGITAALLERSLETLATRDLVLGPTREGGVYLVGLARHAPSIVRGIDWSGHAFEQILARAGQAGLSWAMLPTLSGLGTPAHLASLTAHWLTRAEDRTPHTEAVLVRIGLLPRLG